MAEPATGPTGGVRVHSQPLPQDSANTGDIWVTRNGHRTKVKVSAAISQRTKQITDSVLIAAGLNQRGSQLGVGDRAIRRETISVSLTNRTITYETAGNKKVTKLFADFIKERNPELDARGVLDEVAKLGNTIDTLVADIAKEAKLVAIGLGGKNARVPNCAGTHGGPRPFQDLKATHKEFFSKQLEPLFKKIDKDSSLDDAAKLRKKSVIAKRLVFAHRLQQHMAHATGNLVAKQNEEIGRLEGIAAPGDEISLAKSQLKELEDLHNYYSNLNTLPSFLAATMIETDRNGQQTSEQMRESGIALEKELAQLPLVKKMKLKDRNLQKVAGQMRLMALPKALDPDRIHRQAEKAVRATGINMPRVDFNTQFAGNMLAMGALKSEDLAHFGENGSVNPMSGHDTFFALAPDLKIGEETIHTGDYLRAAGIEACRLLQSDFANIEGRDHKSLNVKFVQNLFSETPNFADITLPSIEAEAEISVGAAPALPPGPPPGPRGYARLTDQFDPAAMHAVLPDSPSPSPRRQTPAPFRTPSPPPLPPGTGPGQGVGGLLRPASRAAPPVRAPSPPTRPSPPAAPSRSPTRSASPSRRANPAARASTRSSPAARAPSRRRSSPVRRREPTPHPGRIRSRPVGGRTRVVVDDA